MDADERARLRALCEAATPGPWETYRPAAGGLGIAHGDPRTHHGCIARIAAGSPADAALMGIARTAIPALLDALDAAERERDEARAEARAAREHMDRAVDEIRRTLSAALRLAAEDEREACAAIADKYAAQEDVAGADACGRVAVKIRARGTGGAPVTRAEAQHLLDAIEPGHALSVSVERHRGTGAVVNAVARWRGEHACARHEAAALRDLVAAAYRVRRLPLPPELDAPLALPGVR